MAEAESLVSELLLNIMQLEFLKQFSSFEIVSCLFIAAFVFMVILKIYFSKTLFKQQKSNWIIEPLCVRSENK